MKKYFRILLFLAVLPGSYPLFAQQSVAINNDGSAPHNSAMLDVKSTIKGMLIPRMSSGQRTGIGSPAKGLQVFDTDTNTLWYYNGSGWVELVTGGGSGAGYWSLDGFGSNNIYNNNAGKILMGTNTAGPGYLNIKSTVNQAGIFMSETGTASADFMFAEIYSGGGTTASRFGSITGNFGGGFQIGNQSNAPLMFQAYNGERMRITPTGYLGINTTNPLAQLEVKAATGFPALTLTDGTARLTTTINSNSSHVIMGTTTNHHLYFSTNNATFPVMTLSSIGNVGIGGVLGSTKLEVATADAQWGITHYNTGAGISVGTYTGSNVGWIATKSNHALAFATSLGNTNNFAQMVLLTNGNFGVGTATPSDKLTVVTPTNNYGIVHTDNNVALTTFVGGSGITAGWLGTKSNHPLGFFTNNGSASMVILQNGNIGIGTNNPAYKLAVNGSIQTKEVRVETGWADYVFDEQYALQPLADVEKYITANKHLPGIPSAAEIRQNGLAVGEVQTKMMEKIEELTLYVIALEKQINQLKNGKK